MRSYLLIPVTMLLLATGCGKGAVEKNSENISQDEIRQTENEINRLDSISSEIDNMKNEIETSLSELDQILENIN